MANQTFHRFPILPGEIRDRIWDLAARPRGYRGVHIFNIIEEGVYNDRPTPSKTFPQHLSKKMYPGQTHFIGAPTPPNDTSPHSWTAGNPSTYAVDGGLLTACKESFMAMCRRYYIGKWSKYINACTRVTDPVQYAHLPEFTFEIGEYLTIFSVKSQGSPQCFVVLPCQDLMLLQVWDTMTDLEWAITKLPLAPRRVGVEVSAVSHIAVEFDSSLTVDGLRKYQCEWQRGYENRLDGIYYTYPHDMELTWWKYDCLVGAMKNWTSSPATRLWLLDLRLRQKHTVLNSRETNDILPDTDEDSDERLVFEAEDSSYYGLPNDSP